MIILEYRNGKAFTAWHSRKCARRCNVKDIREVADNHPDVLALREKQKVEMDKPNLEARIAKLEEKIKKLEKKV